MEYHCQLFHLLSDAPASREPVEVGRCYMEPTKDGYLSNKRDEMEYHVGTKKNDIPDMKDTGIFYYSNRKVNS